MQELAKEYQKQLVAIQEEIQSSDALAAYLESEEDDDYGQLRELFEPRLAELYLNVATHQPLQIISLEQAMLAEALEGLFLPKVLGYSVLRGAIDDQYRYLYPQEQFRLILLAIANSANFEQIRQRIGQTVQVGFALSSNIWVTNLIEEIPNKKVRQFLQSMMLDKFHDMEERQKAYQRYKLQFRNEVFFTADFPENLPDLRRYFPALRNFLGKRITLKLDNSSLMEPIYELVTNAAFHDSYEHNYLLAMFLNFFDPTPESKATAGKIFNELRSKDSEFPDHYFAILAELHHSKYDISEACDRRVHEIVDNSIDDDIHRYYTLLEKVHGVGYIQSEAIEAVQEFYTHHKGVSLVNECVRLTIYRYLSQFLDNLEPTDYPELFEISKIYAAYFQIFDNEHFKQDVKALNMRYVRKLLKTYTDKRGKDYQDIKRFVSATFVDLGFLTDKEVVALFKTRRKKRTATT